MINPAKQHLTICVFHYLGASWCPGCGIGRSISYLLHGDWQNSISTHWLGTFALLIIVYRILQLIINQKQKQNFMENAFYNINSITPTEMVNLKTSRQDSLMIK